MEQALDFTQITLRVIFVVELVQSADLGTAEADGFEVLVGRILELMDGGYFKLVSGERKAKHDEIIFCSTFLGTLPSRVSLNYFSI